MNVLETSRLILRTFKDADFEGMLAINQDPLVMAQFPALVDKAGTQAFIDKINQHYLDYGYTPEAASAVLEYAFRILDLPEVVSFASTANSNSRRVMEKIGLKHDEADDFNHPSLSSDSPLCRHVLYRLFKDDYFKVS